MLKGKNYEANYKEKRSIKRIITVSLTSVAILLVLIMSLVSCFNPGDNSHVHSFGEWTVVKSASCEENGIRERYCDCGEKQSEELYAVGHTFGEWRVKKAPTCIDDGTEFRECKCGKNETRTVEKTNVHDVVTDSAIAPTCINPGRTEGQHCSICEKVIVDSIELPPAGHKYDDRYDADCNICGFKRPPDCRHENTIVKPGLEPTCISAGYTEETVCTNCEEILVSRVNLDPLGHIEGEWTVEQDSTCTANGLEVQRCTRCKAVLNSAPIDPVGHSSGDWKVEKEPTCVVDGLKVQRCTVCSFLVDSKVITATGHVASDWIVENEPTCEQDGNKYKECVKCKEKLENEGIFATGHNYTSFVCVYCNRAQDGVKQIYTLTDLYDVANDLGATYVLMNDIDCQGISLMPIGTDESNAFWGLFEGRGYTIHNYAFSNTDCAGIFGYNKGIIRNLNANDFVINVSSTSSSTVNIGGIVGYNAGMIDQCAVKNGDINITMNNTCHCGLISGYNSGNIINCFVSGNVFLSQKSSSSNWKLAGGITADNSGNIKNCFVDASVYAYGKSEGVVNTYYHGEAALVAACNEKGGVISGCVVMGSVTQGNNRQGDIAGRNNGTISNCHKDQNLVLSGIGNKFEYATSQTLSNMATTSFYSLTLGWDSSIWNFENIDLGNKVYPKLNQN